MSVAYLWTWILVLFRGTGLIFLLPPLGGQSAPVNLRVALAVCLATIVAGVVPEAAMPVDLWSLVLAAAGEILLGLAFGFVVNLTFSAIELAGRLMSSEIGMSAPPGFAAPAIASEPLAGFVSQMLFGIQSSQDVKLSNIGRALQEKIPLIRTEKRLSRNLKSAELEKELTPQLVRMGSSRIQPNTVLALDLSDVRQEYAQKMENLAMVRDGSAGELHLGSWLCDVTGAEVNGGEVDLTSSLPGR